MDKATLTKTLLDMDEEAYLTLGQPSTLHKIIIVGGSAFMLRDLPFSRNQGHQCAHPIA